ncbi:discoidin domain-containing protein [Nostoc muscorum FACHB-395]|nr:discoidin domain-containing protein [Desmonostoc muscorum FACHB-395]
MSQIKDLSIVKTVAEDTDYFVLQNPMTGETYRITKADLFAGLSVGGASSDHQCSYVSDGDTNGLFYYLGRQQNTVTWANPSGNGITFSASGVENGSLSQLSDRANSDFWTPSANNSYVGFHIDVGTLKCNRYSIKSRSSNADYYPRNWQFQASVNGSNWVYLHSHTNDTALNDVNQWASWEIESSLGFSYFRLQTTGVNSSGYYHLCLSEIELYGTFTPN